MIYYKEGITTTRPVIPGVIKPSQETILAAGWKEYVDNRPPYDSNTQTLVSGEVVDGVRQYQVVDLSEEELKSRVLSTTESQAEEIKKHRASCHFPTIICGDLNNSAFSYVYRTIKGNLNDAFEEKGARFGKTFNFKYYPARIDYIFSDPFFEVKDFQTFSYFVNSDHMPIMARLNVKK